MEQDRSTIHSNMSFEFGRQQSGLPFRFWMGLTLLIIGGGLLLDAFDVFDFSSILGMWWPSALMLIAIIQIATRSASIFGAGVLFVVGALMQASKLGILPGGFWSAFWPLILILVGTSMLLGRKKKVRNRMFDFVNGEAMSEDTISSDALFSGNTIRNVSHDFKGGSLSAICGGLDVDLRSAAITKEATIHCTCFCGGIDLKVPPNWRVMNQGKALLGGIDNRTNQVFDPNIVTPTLYITGTVVCGGIDIHH